MSKSFAIEPADREFWGIIAGAAFSNPFSEERVSFDERIVGRRIDPFTEEHLGRLTEVVSERVDRLVREGRGDWRRYGAEDREVMQTVFLFEVFHRFCGRFDELVLAQAEAGEESLKVEFAGEALGLLERRGFSHGEAVHYFAIFYQLRRAYHFIVRALVGQSACMRELRRHLWNNVFTQDVRWYHRLFWNRMEDFSTLLLGETGTGKGTAAAAIGRSGFIPFNARRGAFDESFARAFVSLNLSQYPETLIESELFGHCKGAFTGAVDRHDGLLSRCSAHGAVFLDEIGDVPVPVQIKLLQVLQERVFSPVGSHGNVRFRGRVIAATHRPVEELRREGRFREDFYYRLCSHVIWVPPLRTRLAEDPGELRRLLSHVVARLAGSEESDLVGLVETALAAQVPVDYEWPGNVRELEQATRQILLTGSYRPKRASRADDWRGMWMSRLRAGELDADALLAGYCRGLYQREGSYEGVARRTGLDRRTARKYVMQGSLLAEKGV